MDFMHLLGPALVLLAMAAVVASIFAVARLFLTGNGTSVIDHYLASGAGNRNSPDVPPSYTPVVRGRNLRAEHLDVMMLDPDDTQRQKALDQTNTVTQELRNQR